MKVKYYFYSGNTPVVSGHNIQFSGHYRDPDDKFVVDVLKQIDNYYTLLHNCKICITAFNFIGERDE